MSDYNKYVITEIRRLAGELIKAADGLVGNNVKGITDVDIYIHIPQPCTGDISTIKTSINFVGGDE